MGKRRTKRRRVSAGKDKVDTSMRLSFDLRKFGLVGLGLGVCLFLWVGWQVVSDWGSRSWMGVEPYRYVAVAESRGSSSVMWVIQYFPGDQSVLVYTIDNGIQVDTAKGFGKYRIGSLLDLGKQEGEGTGLLLESVQKALGLYIREVIIVDGREFEDTNQLARWIGKNNWRMMVSSLAGSGNIVDTASVWWEMRGLHGELVDEVTFTDRGIFNVTADVDGAELLTFNDLLLDDLQERMVGSKRLIWHDVSVVVENATRKSGVAAQISRLVTHEGFDVVRLQDSDQYVPQTKIMFASEELMHGFEASLLHQLFPQAQVMVGNTDEYRSDVVIRVGEDLVN